MSKLESWLRANPIQTVLVTIALWASGAALWSSGIGGFIVGFLLYGAGIVLGTTFLRAWWGGRSR